MSQAIPSIRAEWIFRQNDRFLKWLSWSVLCFLAPVIWVKLLTSFAFSHNGHGTAIECTCAPKFPTVLLVLGFLFALLVVKIFFMLCSNGKTNLFRNITFNYKSTYWNPEQNTLLQHFSSSTVKSTHDACVGMRSRLWNIVTKGEISRKFNECLLLCRMQLSSINIINYHQLSLSNIFIKYQLSSTIIIKYHHWLNKVSYWMWVVCLQLHPRTGDIMNKKFDAKRSRVY